EWGRPWPAAAAPPCRTPALPPQPRDTPACAKQPGEEEVGGSRRGRWVWGGMGEWEKGRMGEADRMVDSVIPPLSHARRVPSCRRDPHGRGEERQVHRRGPEEGEEELQRGEAPEPGAGAGSQPGEEGAGGPGGQDRQATLPGSPRYIRPPR